MAKRSRWSVSKVLNFGAHGDVTSGAVGVTRSPRALKFDFEKGMVSRAGIR